MESREFYTTELGKIAMHVVHEHSNAVCGMGGYLSLIRKAIEKDDIVAVKEYTDSMVHYLDKSKEAIDYMYVKLKEIEEGKVDG